MDILFPRSPEVRLSSFCRVCRFFPLALVGLSLSLASCQGDGTATAPNLSVPPEFRVPDEPNLFQLTLVNRLAVTLVPVNRGGIVTECRTSAELPAGLRFERFGNTCALNGTPASVTPTTEYTLSAHNEGGVDELRTRIEVRTATAFFSHINGVAAGDNPSLEIDAQTPVEIVITNSGHAGFDEATSCNFSLSATGAAQTALNGFSARVADNGKDCIIEGAAASPVSADAGASFTITTTTKNTSDDKGNPRTVVGMDVLSFAVSAKALEKCSDLELPDPGGDPGFPVPISGAGVTAGALYVRGNHSNWMPQPDFLFQNKGEREGKAVLQVVAVFDAEEAHAEYTGANAQFKLASDDDNWSTQLWIAGANGSIRTADNGGVIREFGTPLPVQRGDGGVDNNHISLVLGATYSFLLELNSTSSSDGPKGTLTIQPCLPEEAGS